MTANKVPDNPSRTLPDDVASVITESYVSEFSVLRRDRTPVTLPMGNYPDEDGNPQVAIGLSFPWTSELARRNPKVCISYCRTTHPTSDRPPVVVISGHASVRDADLQANTDLYVWWLKERFPNMFGRLPGPMLRAMSFYLARIWVQVTPIRVRWWPDGDATGRPEQWVAPSHQDLPESDPPPQGPPAQIPSRFPSSEDWRPGLDDALARIGPPLLTVVDEDGFPATLPALAATRTEEGALLSLPPSATPAKNGRACLAFHTFEYTGGAPSQENRKFVGSIVATEEGALFTVERELVSASLASTASMIKAFYKVWQMRGRLPVEAARRGQPVPRVGG